MSVSVTVDLPQHPDAVRAWFRDPHRRPEWQTSLRRVEDVRGDGGVGTTWRDVTRPGLRPAMRVTDDTPSRWAETGSWRGWSADLAMEFAPQGSGTRVLVTAGLAPPRWLGWLRRPMERLAVPAIVADVRRAGSLIR